MNNKYKKFDAGSFGKRLANIRNFYKMTQEEVAEHIGVSTKSVQNWENGDKIPAIDNLVCLADCFGMTAGEMLDDERYRLFEKKVDARKQTIETIEAEGKIEVFIEFTEDRYFDRYEVWVWDELAKFKYMYCSVEKLISYNDFKTGMLNQVDIIVSEYRDWLFSVLSESEEDMLIKEAIEDKIKGEKMGMSAKGAVWSGFGKVIYFGD